MIDSLLVNKSLWSCNLDSTSHTKRIYFRPVFGTSCVIQPAAADVKCNVLDIHVRDVDWRETLPFRGVSMTAKLSRTDIPCRDYGGLGL
jgi:3-dehydroquinate dehydratase